jgi:phenylalanyl-tRNA synthetase beta chain
MKLSLSWIFDHLKGSWTDYDVKELVRRFNTTTAEIEHFDHVILNTDHFTLATILKMDKERITAFSSEHAKEFTLPSRPDAKVGAAFMIFLSPKNPGFENKPAHEKSFSGSPRKWAASPAVGYDVRWATLADWHSGKDGLIGALSATEKELEGAWKNSFECEDYILHLDNKSVTHRPDLWGQRGIAREIAALLNIQMRPESEFVKEFPVEKHETVAPAHQERIFSLTIKNSELVKQLGGGYISSIEYGPSLIWMAHRLARVDSRPIDVIVDTTNYIMLELGQPMHAFDAEKIASKKIEAGLAGREQTLELLDRTSITLDADDLVISDGTKALSVAGIMGGASSAVGPATKSILIESGCFDAGVVRKTALRIKKRTESSARFEKSLDPHHVIKSLKRYLTILTQNKIQFKLAGSLVLLGHETAKQKLSVTHDFITSRLGADVDQETIKRILKALGFEIEIKSGSCLLEVPTFRSSKEPFIKEDVVEEVGRFFGYNNIRLAIPALKLKPSSFNDVFQERALKNYCAYALSAHEVTNYAIYDEEFLRHLDWQPKNAVRIQNPVSENWQQMATSLIPHLIKNVWQNKTEQEARFFEYNDVWHQNGKEVMEKKHLAGIIFSKTDINFYEIKNHIDQMLAMFNIFAQWRKSNDQQPWMHPYQTADLIAHKEVIGYAGIANNSFLKKVVDGNAFIFEFDADQLLKHAIIDKQRFDGLSKYPATWFDISMLISRSIMFENISEMIMNADGRIYKIVLVDFYEKDEWKDKRSLTVRFFARDAEKTLSQEEIDDIYDHVLIKLKEIGAVIR